MYTDVHVHVHDMCKLVYTLPILIQFLFDQQKRRTPPFLKAIHSDKKNKCTVILHVQRTVQQETF